LFNDLARLDKGKAIHKAFGGVSAVPSDIIFTSSPSFESPTDAGDTIGLVRVGDLKQSLRMPLSTLPRMSGCHDDNKRVKRVKR
jgi:hypothetical protein